MDFFPFMEVIKIFHTSLTKYSKSFFTFRHIAQMLSGTSFSRNSTILSILLSLRVNENYMFYPMETLLD